MNASPTHQLMAAVREWAAVNYPGMQVNYIKIRLRDKKKSIRLYDTPAVPATPTESGKDAVMENEADHRGLSPIILDVLAILRESNQPLSRTLILEELAKRGKLYNERSVAGYLAQLVQDGTLENISEGRRRGYRIPSGE